jgi:hypothetical protein
MPLSFLDIARFMDPAEPSGSLRTLAQRHRWLGNPPAVLSLRQIALRHENSSARQHRFLWYNTFLLQGFELSVCNLLILGRLLDKLGLDPRQLLGDLGISAAQVVDAMKVSKRTLVDGLGKSLDDLKGAFSNIIDSIPIIGDVGIDDILDDVSMQDVLNKFDVSIDDLLDKLKLDPLEILTRFCQETVSFISDYTGVPLDAVIHISGKPERPARAHEIGATVSSDYDIVALCEVFEQSSHDAIINEAKLRRSDVVSTVGPDDTNALASSGLVTLVLDRAVVEHDHVPFQHKGNPLRDADAWSNKGVSRTVIDVGLGKLEVYSTHLMAGGGIDLDKLVAGNLPGYEESAASDVFAEQRAQLDELVEFVRRTHNRANVAIIVGDFNLSAQNEEKYSALIAAMRELNMLDAWPFYHFRVQASFAETNSFPPGPTSSGGTVSGVVFEGLIGTVETSRVNAVCCPETGPFCVDGQEANKSPRIDYVFIEEPRAEHSFMLDITRIRRKPFARTGSNIVSELWLSDHLGLDFALLVSPR